MTEKTSIADVSPRCGKLGDSFGTEVLDVQTFNFMGVDVRAGKVGDDLWFVAKDVSDALEYHDATHATRHLDGDEKGLRIVETLRGNQELNVITESGLYHLLVSSRKPKAKPFRRWVTHEVLPTINRTGTYSREPAKLIDLHGAPREIAEFEILNSRYSYLLDRNVRQDKIIGQLGETIKILLNNAARYESRITELERTVSKVDKVFDGKVDLISKEQISEIDPEKQIKAIILVVG